MTERRKRRIEEVLSKRQHDLVLVLEDLYKEHNVSAIIRSADAFGVLRIYVVKEGEFRYAPSVSRGSEEWVDVIVTSSIEDVLVELKGKGFQIVATYLGEGTVRPEEVDFTLPTAIVLGNELEGVSEKVIEISDVRVKIPTIGMVTSLNVSVACGILLYEAMKQRERKGFFRERRLPPELYEWMRKRWMENT
ncbi:tRNA (guanine-N2)-dimethyltransferase [bacterium]|nr:MAG: tRNA (guanine-N2)-dimethyltransferase [bacterium]